MRDVIATLSSPCPAPAVPWVGPGPGQEYPSRRVLGQAGSRRTARGPGVRGEGADPAHGWFPAALVSGAREFSPTPWAGGRAAFRVQG